MFFSDKLSIHGSIPILLMSSRNSIHDSAYYKTHWDDYIEKPFEMEAINQMGSDAFINKAQQD